MFCIHNNFSNAIFVNQQENTSYHEKEDTHNHHLNFLDSIFQLSHIYQDVCSSNTQSHSAVNDYGNVGIK